MKIIYTDENSRLKDLSKVINSKEFRDFVNGNLGRITKYDHGMTRVKPELCKERFNVFLKAEGFEFGGKTEHANGIGNNNMHYVLDIDSGEFIGALHLNSNMSGSVYCYATDINRNRVSHTYSISQYGISFESSNFVDWSRYQFGKEEEAFKVIHSAIEAGVLLEGPTGGVLVIKEFEDKSEGWVEITKAEAAKDLVSQNKVQAIMNAINDRNKRSLDSMIADAVSNTPVAGGTRKAEVER